MRDVLALHYARLLGQIDPKADTAIVNFSMDKARACARRVATKLAPLNPDQWKSQLDLLDLEVTALSNLVRNPIGLIFKLGLLVIPGRESNNVASVIEVLNRTPTARVRLGGVLVVGHHLRSGRLYTKEDPVVQ